MKITKLFLIGSALLLAATVLFAGGAQEKKPEKITLTFNTLEAGFPTEWWERWNAENPNLQIERTQPDWTKFVADAMAGTADDLILLGSGADIAYSVERGLFLDLTDYFKNAKLFDYDDIDQMGNSSYRWDGKEFGKGPWYGLARDFNNIGCITYNKEMFEEAGLAPLSETQPITYYDDLYDLAKKLTKKDASGTIEVWGTEFANWQTYLTSDMAYAEGVSFFNEDRSIMNEDPKMRNLWKYWTRFQTEDLAPNVRNPASGWQGTDFQSGRVAMVQLGYWFGASLKEDEDYVEKYGWAPTPVLRKGAERYTNTLGATGLVIYSGTKYPDEAFRFFEWYMAGDYAVSDAKSGWGIPPLLSLRKYLPQDNPFDKSRTQIAFDDAKYFVPFENSPYMMSDVLIAAYANNIDDLVLGKIDADTFVDKMYAEANEQLKLGKEELQ